jgi:LPXTG-motif cell wall-anchored protein
MKLNKKLSSYIVVTILVIFLVNISYAAAVEPEYIGVDDPGISGYEKFIIDEPKTGSFVQGILTIDLIMNSDGNNVEWDSNIEIEKVLVKGSTNGYLYNYSYSEYKDSNVYPPVNEGGEIPQIEYLVFYYKTDSVTYNPVEQTPIIAKNTTITKNSTNTVSSTTPAKEVDITDNQANSSDDSNIVNNTVTPAIEKKDIVQNTIAENKLPKTGEKEPLLLYLIGSILIGIGIIIYFKNRFRIANR